MGDISRIGCFAGRYSWIAMLHYAEVNKMACEVLGKKELPLDIISVSVAIENKVMITVTFAAMALEAFFNDYGARKFGDKFYYDNFEMLRPTGKLQLISKFVFGVELEKGEHLFQLVDKLFKMRNEYVHNKSKDFHGQGMTEEEVLLFEKMPINIASIFESEKDDIRCELKKAFDAIKALCEVAKFIEKMDDESYVMSILLSANGMVSYDKEEQRKVKQVQREFGIPEIIMVDDI